MSLEVIRKFNMIKPTDLSIDALILRQTINYLMKDVFPKDFYVYLLGARKVDIASHFGFHIKTVSHRIKKYLSLYSEEFYPKDFLNLEELFNFISKLKFLNEQQALMRKSSENFTPFSSYEEEF